MDCNFERITDYMLLAVLEQKSPKAAKMLKVIMKHGLSYQKALACLMELSTVIDEFKQGGDPSKNT